MPPDAPDPAFMLLNREPGAGIPMSTARASKLESLILEKICGLEYVSKVGYIDDGSVEVFILVVHDHDPDRDSAMVRGIGDGGRAIGREMRDRMITALPIPDSTEDTIDDSKIIYEREARQ